MHVLLLVAQWMFAADCWHFSFENVTDLCCQTDGMANWYSGLDTNTSQSASFHSAGLVTSHYFAFVPLLWEATRPEVRAHLRTFGLRLSPNSSTSVWQVERGWGRGEVKEEEKEEEKEEAQWWSDTRGNGAIFNRRLLLLRPLLLHSLLFACMGWTFFFFFALLCNAVSDLGKNMCQRGWG